MRSSVFRVYNSLPAQILERGAMLIDQSILSLFLGVVLVVVVGVSGV